MDKEQHLEADEQHVPATPSPGQVLREAREQQNLTQQAIADKLYLKVGIIDDIEQNRIDEHTSITFIKGYVRLYAKTLGLNQQEMITLFEQYHTTPKPPAKLQSFSRRVAKQAHDDRWMMVTYGIALILIAGIVIWWFQQSANENEASTATDSAVNTPPAVSSPAESDDALSDSALNSQPATQNTPSESGLPQSSVATADTLPEDLDVNDERNASGESVVSMDSETPPTQPGSVQNELTTVGEPEAADNTDADAMPTPDTSSSDTDKTTLETQSGSDASTAGSSAEQPAPENTTPQSPSSENVATNDQNGMQTENVELGAPVELIFTFSGECWVNLTDATGEAIAYGIKASGYEMRVSGIPPFEVTLGAPGVVEIEYDGEEVDMSGFNPSRTAKFLLPRQEQ